MKTLFRNLTVTAFCFAVSVFNASADNAKPIAFNQLPAQAQQFVKQHFADSKVVVTTLENEILDKSYDVALENGTKLEFNNKGEWTEVTCTSGCVPCKVLPQGVTNYLKANFPKAEVKKIERDNGRYEVELRNGTEITFNKKFQVTDIDL
jgi:hypothetical protein